MRHLCLISPLATTPTLRPASHQFVYTAFFFICLLASLATDTERVSAAPLDSRVGAVTNKGSASRALWGIYAVDARNGDVLADLNGDRLFVPASNRKLLSTALAARSFDADHRFRTELRAGQLSPQGVVQGDIVFHASGDPSWMPELLGGRPGQSKLRELAQMAAAAGLREVTGSLVIDTSLFEDPAPLGPGWSWDNLADSYASRAAVFSINANLAPLILEPAAVGNPVRVSTGLPFEPFEIINESTTLAGGAAPTFHIDRRLDGGQVILAGGLPAGSGAATRSIPIGNPVRYNAQLLRNALADAGITLRGEIVERRASEKGAILLAVVEGATISDMLAECNESSDNFLAESLYLLCSARRYGRANYRGAQQAETEYWKKLGVDPREIEPADGSGLSRKNLISPRAFVALLRDMEQVEAFKESLPVSGRSGTLRYRLAENGLAGRVRAKTGTLDGVSALSGYVITNSGHTVVFSIMANNHTGSANSMRQAIDEIVAVLASR